MHTKDNRVGGVYTFNYDLLRTSMLQQRLTGFYNAQCCGVTASYQTYNFSGFTSTTVAKDRRFSISISLAGIGSFAPPFGGMGSPVSR